MRQPVAKHSQGSTGTVAGCSSCRRCCSSFHSRSSIDYLGVAGAVALRRGGYNIRFVGLSPRKLLIGSSNITPGHFRAGRPSAGWPLLRSRHSSADRPSPMPGPVASRFSACSVARRLCTVRPPGWLLADDWPWWIARLARHDAILCWLWLACSLRSAPDSPGFARRDPWPHVFRVVFFIPLMVTPVVLPTFECSLITTVGPFAPVWQRRLRHIRWATNNGRPGSSSWLGELA
jgi:hypothetical protein